MKIFVTGAHLDDLELACGGTLAKAIESGHEVKALILSKSGYTNYTGQVMRTDEEAVQEGVEALNILGIEQIEILDFPNKDIGWTSDVVEAIDARMNAFDPDVIFTHHPFDTHQSHVGVCHATISAARRRNTVLFFEPIAPSGRSYVAFKPQMYVDISDTIGKKLEALKKHKSEMHKFGDDYWIRGIKSRAAFRGYEMGTEYAESFEILRCAVNFHDFR